MNEILEILKEYRAIFQRGGKLCEDDIIDLQNKFNKFIEAQQAMSCDGCVRFDHESHLLNDEQYKLRFQICHKCVRQKTDLFKLKDK